MANYIEYDCNSYIQSRETIQEMITAIDVIILNNLKLIGSQTLSQAGGTNMYEVDDGQARIKVIYKSVNELLQVNTGLRKLKNVYIAELNGSVTVLRDKGTLRGWGYAGWGGWNQ